MQTQKLKSRAILLLVLLLSSVFANNDHTLSWDAGIELASFRDDLIVPLAFNGPGLALGLQYQFKTNNWQVNFPASFKFDFVLNRYRHMGAAFSLDLNPHILKPLPIFENYGQFKAGFALPFKINNNFPFSWDDAHLYWFTINSLALALEWNQATKSKFPVSIHIELPLISRISRPPDYRHDKQDDGLSWLSFKSTAEKRQYETASPSDYQGLLIRGNYASWALVFEIDHYAFPDPVWALNTSIRYSKAFRSW